MECVRLTQVSGNVSRAIWPCFVAFPIVRASPLAVALPVIPRRLPYTPGFSSCPLKSSTRARLTAQGRGLIALGCRHSGEVWSKHHSCLTIWSKLLRCQCHVRAGIDIRSTSRYNRFIDGVKAPNSTTRKKGRKNQPGSKMRDDPQPETLKRRSVG